MLHHFLTIDLSSAIRILLIIIFGAACIGKLFYKISSLESPLVTYAPGKQFRKTQIYGVLALEGLASIGLATPYYPYAALLVSVLCVLFIYVVASSLRQGERSYCNCFGRLLRLQISPALLAFDLALLGLSLFLVTENVIAIDLPALVILCAYLAVLLIVGLSVQSLLVRLDAKRIKNRWEKRIMSQASQRSLRDLFKEHNNFHNADRDFLLLFLSTNCSHCRRLISQSLLTGNEKDIYFLFREKNIAHLTLDNQPSRYLITDAKNIFDFFDIIGTPSLIEIRDGVIKSAKLPATQTKIKEYLLK